jgi:hypothetical protein
MALTQGFYQIFDLADLPLLQKHKWYANWKTKGYLQAVTKVSGQGDRTQSVHRLLFGRQMDHINASCDSDGLDNRRRNLRPASALLNANNSRLRRQNSSGFNGVSLQITAHASYWVAAWQENGKTKNKHFRVTPEIDSETAKQMAIACRKAADLRTGCTNGRREKRR